MNNQLKEQLLFRYFYDLKYMEEMVTAQENTVKFAKLAITDFYNNPPDDWQEWPIWETPEVWKIRVIPNFEGTLESMKDALDEAKNGEFKWMKYLTESMRGISKNMESIGWKWWLHVSEEINNGFDVNFDIVKKHSGNIYWTLNDEWNGDEIRNERITGKIDEKLLYPYLKPGEFIN